MAGILFFRLFPTVKTLHIFGMFAVQLASALEAGVEC
jgi:hypothetical protein